MRTIFASVLVVVIFLSIQIERSVSQTCTECICGTAPVPVGFDPNPDSFRGGLFISDEKWKI
jgi:hypothetical protein